MFSPTQTPFAQNPTRGILLLVSRVILGLVFIGHGWDKFTHTGLDATAVQFEQAGVPAPAVAAFVAAAIELIGGILLVVGAFTWIACVALAALMFGAFFFVHRGNGLLIENGGWELVGALGTACIFLALASAGRYSIDGYLNDDDDRPRRTRRRRRSS
ncbi:MAG: DoxX family protein [Micrococcales bacterium]|nr:DoxX family protein [Micrococcales bacterium]